MNIVEALKEPILLLPKKYDEDTFPVFLEKCYSDFLEALDKIDSGTIVEKIKVNRETLGKLCAGLIKSINTYFKGFPDKAYFEFESALLLIHEFLFLSSGTVFNEWEPYYRARLGENKQFERKDLFHIPFELREYVTTQRFSVPGLPCLYLSNSTYVCWEELRQPNVDKMQISRLKLTNMRFNFLDLSLTPDYLRLILETSTKNTMKTKTGEIVELPTNLHMTLDTWDKMTLNYIMRWPLIAACSIRVKKQDGTFKPEYIFPQFLLQWVTQNKNIDGIKYFSIAANSSSKLDYSQLINYAIPVKEISSSGYCKTLADSFQLTEPVSWEFLTMADPNIIQHNQEKFKANIYKLGKANLISRLELTKGRKKSYWHTIFGKLEIEMSDMDFLSI